MNNTLNIEVQEYEVMEANTSKYASTQVVGGPVVGYRNVVDHHTDQTIWLRRTSDNHEWAMDMAGQQLDVRAGHKIFVAFEQIGNNKLSRLRAHNLNTGASLNFVKEPQMGKYIPLLVGPFFFLVLLIPLLGQFISLLTLADEKVGPKKIRIILAITGFIASILLVLTIQNSSIALGFLLALDGLAFIATLEIGQRALLNSMQERVDGSINAIKQSIAQHSAYQTT